MGNQNRFMRQQSQQKNFSQAAINPKLGQQIVYNGNQPFIMTPLVNQQPLVNIQPQMPVQMQL